MSSSKKKPPCLSDLPLEIKHMIMFLLDPHTIPSLILLNREFNKILSMKEDQEYVARKLKEKHYLLEDRLVRLPLIPDDTRMPHLKEHLAKLQYRLCGANLVVLYLMSCQIEKSKQYTAGVFGTEPSTNSFPPPRVADRGFWDKVILQTLDGGLPYLMALEDQVVSPVTKSAIFIYRTLAFVRYRLVKKKQLYWSLLIQWRATIGPQLDMSNEKHMIAKTGFAFMPVQALFLDILSVKEKMYYVDTLSKLAGIIRRKLDLKQWLCINGGRCRSPGPRNRSAHEKCHHRAILMRLLPLPIKELADLIYKVFDSRRELNTKEFFRKKHQSLLFAIPHTHSSNWTGPRCKCLAGSYILLGNEVGLIKALLKIEREILEREA